MRFFILAVIGFISNYFLIRFLKPFLFQYFLDSPGERSAHKVPIPTGAGISFVLTSVLSYFLLKWNIPLLCFPLALVGFVDDKFNISRFFRYFTQILTALLLIKISSENNVFLSFLFELNIISILFLIIFVISVTTVINFSNFMDGLDGLLGSSYLVAFSFLSITYDQNLILLTAAILSFLVFNWHPAKVFMGDSGSTFLGALYAGLVMQDGDFIQIVTKLLILSPIFMDSFFTLIRRIINKQKFFKPHKLHLYQRLSQSGMSDQRISFIYATGVLVICFATTLNNFYLTFFIVFLEFCLGLYLNSIAKSFIRT